MMSIYTNTIVPRSDASDIHSEMSGLNFAVVHFVLNEIDYCIFCSCTQMPGLYLKLGHDGLLSHLCFRHFCPNIFGHLDVRA